MRSFVKALIPLSALAAGAGGARGAAPVWNRVVLVELFTSQGCSSCPPADALVRGLPARGLGRDKVVPLTFHVDYWDHLGWRDPFALSAFTRRQADYVRSGRLRPPTGEARAEIGGVYTPQMIIDGQVQLPGGREKLVTSEIQRAAARAATVELAAQAAVEGEGVSVKVEIAPRPGLDRGGHWRLIVALAAQRAETRVLHGENGGETLEEAAVVRALSAPMPVTFPAAGPDRVQVQLRRPPDLDWGNAELVAFVQDERTKEVAGAVGTRLR
jgi:hypothetical protein